jgi:shikimate kinase
MRDDHPQDPDGPTSRRLVAGRILFLVGPSGSGKTVIGERAAKLSRWSLIDTDTYILQKTGFHKISDLFDASGEGFFREQEGACVDDIAKTPGNLIVATGGGLPAIPGMMNRLNELGVSVYLKAALDTLWKRLNTDPNQLDNRPLLRSDGKDTLRRLLEKREETYASATVTLDTDQLSVDEVSALLRTQLRLMQRGI